MQLVRSSDEPPYITFIAPAAGGTMIELYDNPLGEFLDYGRYHPLTLHLAFLTDDMSADCARLIAAGATLEGDIMTMPNGDKLAMLRDPWGHVVQLVKRAA